MLYSDFNATITSSSAAWEMEEQLLAQTARASQKFARILIHPNQLFRADGQ